jgi:hypothetical protein
VVEVAKASRGAVDGFDLAVDGLDGTGGRTAGAEVGQHLARQRSMVVVRRETSAMSTWATQPKNRSGAIRAAKRSGTA